MVKEFKKQTSNAVEGPNINSPETSVTKEGSPIRDASTPTLSFAQKTLAAFHAGELTIEAAEQALSQEVMSARGKDPKANALGLLGYFANLRHNSAQAEDYYSQAYSLLPQDKIILSGYATVLFQNGKLAEALAIFKEAIKRSPNNAINLSNAAMVASLTGNFEESEQFFKRAIELNPEDIKTITCYGASLLKEGKNSEAEAELRKACKLNPRDPICLSLLAKLYMQAKYYDKAQTCLAQVLTFDPENNIAKYLSAKIFYLKGDSAKALSQILELIQSGVPANRDEKFKITTLGLLKAISPNHPAWPALREQLSEDILSGVDGYRVDQADDLESGLYRNTLWGRTYRSLPVNRQASKGVRELPKP
jgi:tetratricopeptide (TPR) repeat protein